jgi:hypothetical protein
MTSYDIYSASHLSSGDTTNRASGPECVTVEYTLNTPIADDLNAPFMHDMRPAFEGGDHLSGLYQVYDHDGHKVASIIVGENGMLVIKGFLHDIVMRQTHPDTIALHFK